MSTQKSKEEPQLAKSLTLVSPGGHKYEISVSDSGNLNVSYKPEAAADKDEA